MATTGFLSKVRRAAQSAPLFLLWAAAPAWSGETFDVVEASKIGRASCRERV